MHDTQITVHEVTKVNDEKKYVRSGLYWLIYVPNDFEVNVGDNLDVKVQQFALAGPEVVTNVRNERTDKQVKPLPSIPIEIR